VKEQTLNSSGTTESVDCNQENIKAVPRTLKLDPLG